MFLFTLRYGIITIHYISVNSIDIHISNKVFNRVYQIRLMSEKQKQKEPYLKDNDELNKLIEEFNEDVNITFQNIREKSFLVSTIRAKWLARYFKEKENLERIKKAKAKILQQKMGDSQTKESILRLKNETAISKNDETIQKLNAMAKITQDNIEYIERGFSILDNLGFSIKNIIELLKMESV